MKDIIYEFAYLISGEFNEIQAQDLAKKIEKTLGDSGVIISSAEPKRIKLAYPIKKQQEGFLVSIDFTAEPKNLIGISNNIEKEANILRFLIIKKSAQKPDEQKEERKTIEEKLEPATEPVVKEKKKTKKPASAEAMAGKEEDLKKIEKDLDEILGQ